MTFATDLALVPFTARGTTAAGFLPPIMRATGHILFATALAADDRELATEEEILRELTEAEEHWHVIGIHEELSAAANQDVQNLGACITSAKDEFATWTAAAKTSNLRELANRTAAIAARLDRELIGLRDSDPGYQL